ncbi:hypothetical protein LOAG_04952, partial [Loa loa]
MASFTSLSFTPIFLILILRITNYRMTHSVSLGKAKKEGSKRESEDELIKWNNEGKTVTWTDVTVKVPLAKKSLLQCLKIAREPRKTKTILSKVSGYAMPGTTLAIMGS